MNKINGSSLLYLNSPVTDICCPVCDFTNGKLLYSVTSQESAQHFVLKEVYPDRNRLLAEHISALWGKETCDLVSCDSCGFVFANPYVAGDSDFYTLAYERTGYPKWKWEYQKTADAISKIVSQQKETPVRLLEIGAGDGAFVRSISPTLVEKENILCLEFSEYGRNQIQAYGIQCKGNDVHSLTSVDFNDKFDIICMFQVLEHMDRLKALFHKLNDLSLPHTHIFISVPNAERIRFNENNSCLLDMPPNHIGRWNRQAFEHIGANFGWTIADYQTEPFNFKETLKQQITYRYLKRCQNSSSIGNAIEQLSSERSRRLLRNLCAGLYSLTALPTLFNALSDKNIGDSQWVHFVKRP